MTKRVSHLQPLRGVFVLSDITGSGLVFPAHFRYSVMSWRLWLSIPEPWEMRKKKKKKQKVKKHCSDVEKRGHFQTRPFFPAYPKLMCHCLVCQPGPSTDGSHRARARIRATSLYHTHTHMHIHAYSSPWWRENIISTRTRASSLSVESKQRPDRWRVVLQLTAGLGSAPSTWERLISLAPVG